MNNQDTTNESIIIEDLNVENAEEVKGGPTLKVKRDLVMKSSVAESGNGDNSLQGVSLNHNETVSEDNAEIEDLAVEKAEEVKGGPTPKLKRDLVLKSSVAESGNGDNSLQGVSPNHNETVSEDNEAVTENIDDLPVSDEQSSEIAGGLLVPAVQKVREAAAR